MEDRYLFKAKRLDNGEWVEGYLSYPFCTKKGNESYYFYAKDSLGFFCRCVVDASTICQCTGLKDKNGKLIFENDIVKHDFGEYQIGVQLAIVKYDSKYACYQIKPIFDWMYCDKSDCEVIGNIFDNPELLELLEV